MRKGKRLSDEEVLMVCKYYLDNQHLALKQIAAQFGISWKQANRAINKGVVVSKILTLRVSPVPDPKDSRKTHQ